MSPWGSVLPAGLYDPTHRSPFPVFTRSSSASETSVSEAAPAQSTLAQKFLQGGGSKLMLPSASEGGKRKIELYSGEFYAACTFGGVLSCGLTHTAVTPLDVVKCNSQVRTGSAKDLDMSKSPTESFICCCNRLACDKYGVKPLQST